MNMKAITTRAIAAFVAVAFLHAAVVGPASARTNAPVTAISTATMVGGMNSDKENDREFVLYALLGAWTLTAILVVSNTSDADDGPDRPLPVSGG